NLVERWIEFSWSSKELSDRDLSWKMEVLSRQHPGLTTQFFDWAFPDGRLKDSNRSKRRKRRVRPGPRRRKEINRTWNCGVYGSSRQRGATSQGGFKIGARTVSTPGTC